MYLKTLYRGIYTLDLMKRLDKWALCYWVFSRYGTVVHQDSSDTLDVGESFSYHGLPLGMVVQISVGIRCFCFAKV